MDYDLIITGGTVVTAADVFSADVGIKDGRIVAIAETLAGHAAEVIDATGKLVMPGGIDSHVHLAQDGAPGIVMGDDFRDRHALGHIRRKHHGHALLPTEEGPEPSRCADRL